MVEIPRASASKALSSALLELNPIGGRQLSVAKSHLPTRSIRTRSHRPLMQSTTLFDNLKQMADTFIAETFPASGGQSTVPLGDLRVPKMGMGTLNWPLDKTEDENSLSALQACVDADVFFFDTAEAYGFGKSEELLKDCIQKSGAPVIVATKFAPVPWRQKPSDVVDAARASAERLGVDSIDLYQIHFPDIIQPFAPFGLDRRKEEEYWEGIAMAYEEGIIKNIGVSNYGPELLERAIDYLGKRGIKIASNQINYSLLYRKGSQATVDFCRERGITVLGYFPLANGLLAGKYSADNLPKFPKSLTMKKYIAGGVEQGGVVYPEGGVTPLIDEMRRIAEKREKTVAQVAINYVIAKGVVPIPGCRDAEMAKENCGALGWLLNDDEVRSLEDAADSIGFEFSSGGFKLE